MASIFALAAVGLSIAGGCTLALDHPGTITDTCRFDGADDTQCGRCVRDSCGAQLRACCGDASCQDTLGALDDCAGGADQAACGQVREDPTLGACVTASCKDECRGEGGGSCIDLDTSCTCNDLAPSDTATCSETKVGGGICCADLGWPGSGLRCDCSAFRCKETSDGCSCSTYDDGPLTSCSGTHCCLSSNTCSCGETACGSYETELPECSPDLLTCANRGRVTSCSESVD